MTRFVEIEHAYLTGVGARHSYNQDNLAIHLASNEKGWQQRGHLFLVADGMGAHTVGEKASELASQIIPNVYEKKARRGTPRPPPRFLRGQRRHSHLRAAEPRV